MTYEMLPRRMLIGGICNACASTCRKYCECITWSESLTLAKFRLKIFCQFMVWCKLVLSVTIALESMFWIKLELSKLDYRPKNINPSI
jgi:hypothetical protein